MLVTIPAAGVSLVLEPAERKIAPRTVYEAKFSLQYSTAAMLVHGAAGLSAFSDEAIADRRVLDLARRVRYETKEYETYPAAFPGGVRITMRDGKVLEAELPLPARRAGEPALGRRGAREVPRERRAGAGAGGGRVAGGGDPLAGAARGT